jgi:hypothetical protein
MTRNAMVINQMMVMISVRKTVVKIIKNGRPAGERNHGRTLTEASRNNVLRPLWAGQQASDRIVRDQQLRPTLFIHALPIRVTGAQRMD